MGKIEVEIKSYDYPEYEKFSKGERVKVGEYEISHGVVSHETALGKFEGHRVFYTTGPGISFEFRSGVFVTEDNYNRAIRAIEASRRTRILKVLSAVDATYTVLTGQ